MPTGVDDRFLQEKGYLIPCKPIAFMTLIIATVNPHNCVRNNTISEINLPMPAVLEPSPLYVFLRLALSTIEYVKDS